MKQQQQITTLQRMFAAAQQAHRAGHRAQAEALYRDILKQMPDAHDVRHQLAVLLASSGKAAEAITHFRHILKAHPKHAPTHVNLANALTEAGQYTEAIKEYQQALKLDPKLVWALVHLGNVLRMTDKCADALPHYRHALELDPKNAQAFCGMGLAYREQGDLPRALECLENAVGQAPGNADFRMNFAVTLNKAGMPELAIEQFYEATRLSPNSVDVLVLLGQTLAESRRHDEAKECFDRALLLKSDEPELIERRAFVYLELGNAEKALEEFGRVHERNPERPMALLGLGRGHLMAGHTSEAASVMESFVSQFPDDSRGYYFLSSSRKFKPEDPLIDKLASLADQSEKAGRSAIELNFALGKIYDDCKQWDLAFEHYARANKLRLAQCNQPQNEDTRLKAMIEVFTRDFIESHRHLGSESHLPVLIVGMPRSGTTLTEQIISSHPQVIGGGELDFWANAQQAMPLTLGTADPFPECVVQITSEKALEVANRYIELLSKIAGPEAHAEHVTDKMPHNFRQLGLIAMLFPNAPIIHCKRDAMDNCLSIYFQNFNNHHAYSFDLERLGQHYKNYEKLMAHWHEVLPGRILDIQYEDTIADPEYWSRKLIEHVGLEWDDACLSPHKQDRVVKTPSLWQVRQPIYKTSVARWKHYEQYLDPLKDALGYQEPA